MRYSFKQWMALQEGDGILGMKPSEVGSSSVGVKELMKCIKPTKQITNRKTSVGPARPSGFKGTSQMVVSLPVPKKMKFFT